MEKLLTEIYPKISPDDYEKLANDLLRRWIEGEAEFDISYSKVTFKSPRKLDELLARKYKLKLKYVRKVVELILIGLRYTLAGADETILKNLKKDKRQFATALFRIGDNLIKKYPGLKNRFLTVTFCKTRYLDDFDWEINLKTYQPKHTGFEKSDRYPVCMLRFTLGLPTAFRKESPEEPEEFSFEAGSQDINTMIRTLTEIKERMTEVDQKLAKGEI